MNQEKVGGVIRSLRKNKHLTQQQLADKMNISDKAVSKWERGMGAPDLSLIPKLSSILEVDLEALLTGELCPNEPIVGNMKKMKFYVCPECGNLLTATGKAQVSCCGKKLEPLPLKKATESEKLCVSQIEHEYFVSSSHQMTREHYIAFVAFLTGDTLILQKKYPEWDLETRIPFFSHGMLLWYCTQHGLFYQMI